MNNVVAQKDGTFKTLHDHASTLTAKSNIHGKNLCYLTYVFGGIN